jgi:hypothetical protein
MSSIKMDDIWSCFSLLTFWNVDYKNRIMIYLSNQENFDYSWKTNLPFVGSTDLSWFTVINNYITKVYFYTTKLQENMLKLKLFVWRKSQTEAPSAITIKIFYDTSTMHEIMSPTQNVQPVYNRNLVLWESFNFIKLPNWKWLYCAYEIRHWMTKLFNWLHTRIKRSIFHDMVCSLTVKISLTKNVI